MGVIFFFTHFIMDKDNDDDISYVVLGHHSDEIHSVFQCMKWMTVVFIVVCIGIIVLCVLI